MQVPWGDLGLIVGVTYLAAMLSTLVLAGCVSPAEALLDR